MFEEIKKIVCRFINRPCECLKYIHKSVDRGRSTDVKLDTAVTGI